MSPTTKRILLALGLVFLGGIMAAFLLPEGFRRQEMYSESDGRRQRDWKYLGFIPYSTTEVDKSLHVTADYWKELGASGLKPDPGFAKGKPEILIRNFFATSMTYYCRTTVEAKYADLGRFYATQLKTKAVSSGTETFLHGTLPNGKQGEVQLWKSGLGSKPGQDRVEVVIELTFGKAK